MTARVYGSWKEYIEALTEKWVGKKVQYECKEYSIVKVDYNGILHIDKPSEYNWTTAVFEPHEAEKALI